MHGRVSFTILLAEKLCLRLLSLCRRRFMIPLCRYRGEVAMRWFLVDSLLSMRGCRVVTLCRFLRGDVIICIIAILLYPCEVTFWNPRADGLELLLYLVKQSMR